MTIRRNDTVVLLKDITSCRNVEGTPVSRKGERTRVLRVFPRESKVLLQNCNFRWKHVRPSQEHPRGGRIQKEAKVDASNVMLYCEKCRRGSRVRVQRGPEGRRRLCARCNNPIAVVS